jgi:hypothetical protein
MGSETFDARAEVFKRAEFATYPEGSEARKALEKAIDETNTTNS